jgi:hypothetical protein
MSSINSGENIFLTENTSVKEVRLVNVDITDENTALNVIVSFLSLAHKRGAFGIDESAKIWECIKIFQKTV